MTITDRMAAWRRERRVLQRVSRAAWSSSRRGALSDGTPVIISGDIDGAVRVWRTADATPVVPPLHLRESVQAVVLHSDVIITSAGADIAVRKPNAPTAYALAAVCFWEQTTGR